MVIKIKYLNIVLVLLALLASFFIGYLLGARTAVREAEATSFHTVWSPYGHWSNWSECEANKEGEQCGVVGGSRERHRTRVCILLPGGGGNQCAFGTTDTQHQYDECEVELQACIEPTPVCTDAGAANYDPEVGENEFEDNSTCVPREPNVPQGPYGAPQCTDSTPLILPSNVHVVRSGSDATVNFFTSSSNANIYFKEISANDWQHAVRDIPVSGGYVSYTIHDLVPSLGYTFGIQAANSCAGGETVVAVVVDGPASVTFPLTFWQWLR